MTAAEGTALKRLEVKRGATRREGARFEVPFSLRCGALLIDYVVLVSIIAATTLVSRMLGGGARFAGGSAETVGVIVVIVAAVLNLGVYPGLTGKSVGKWAAGLKIERVGGAEIGIARALLRHFVGYPLSFALLGIGFLLAVFTARGRALHDMVAGTVVVREASFAQARNPRTQRSI